MHRAEVGHRFRRPNSIRRLKSWLKATRPTMRWRPSPAFSTRRKAAANPRKPRSRSKGPWPLRPSPRRLRRSRRTVIPSIGPGPMAAIRFKWTVRLDNGDYYVDETIGENSAPLVTGPMSTGSRDPDGRRSRKRRTPALRAIEERDDRTRRRRQSGPQGQRPRHSLGARFAGALSRRPQKILLGNIDAGMAQDVVGRRDMKEELRNAERQQQRFAGEFSLARRS